MLLPQRVERSAVLANDVCVADYACQQTGRSVWVMAAPGAWDVAAPYLKRCLAQGHRGSSLDELGQTGVACRNCGRIAVPIIDPRLEMSNARGCLSNARDACWPPTRHTCPQLKAEGSGFTSDFRVEVSGDFRASSYNVGVVCWEPLVEPWRPHLRGSLAQIDGKTSLKVELKCEQVGDISVDGRMAGWQGSIPLLLRTPHGIPLILRTSDHLAVPFVLWSFVVLSAVVSLSRA